MSFICRGAAGFRLQSNYPDYRQYTWHTDLDTDVAPPGLNEDIVRLISAKKDEPTWMLEWRLDAYRRWLTMEAPTWARVEYPEIDFNEIYFYSAPKNASGPRTIDEIIDRRNRGFIGNTVEEVQRSDRCVHAVRRCDLWRDVRGHLVTRGICGPGRTEKRQNAGTAHQSFAKLNCHLFPPRILSGLRRATPRMP